MTTPTTYEGELKIRIRDDKVVLSLTENDVDEPYIEVPLTGEQALQVATSLIGLARKVGP